MVCWARAQEHTPLAGYLRTEALIFMIVGLLILCSKNVLGL